MRGAALGLSALLLGAATKSLPPVAGRPAAATHQDGTQAKPTVVLELFTSEGCSTCPPADLLLSDLQNKPVIPGVDVIAFEEHVDYWNNGGWTDIYSSHQWTERQEEYQSAFGKSRDAIYTPQLVVDGHKEIVGSRTNEVLALVVAESKQPQVAVKIVAGTPQKRTQSFTVSVASLSADSATADAADADVMLAVSETGLHSAVKAGENAGKALQHAAVLRRLDKIGTIRTNGSAFSGTPIVKIESSWKPENLRVVVVVQERKSRRILGAAEVRAVPASN